MLYLLLILLLFKFNYYQLNDIYWNIDPLIHREILNYFLPNYSFCKDNNLN